MKKWVPEPVATLWGVVGDARGWVAAHTAAALGTITGSVVVLVLIVVFWDWLSDGESGSTTIRNVGLVVGGVVALGIAVWRAQVADRQADTARRSLLHERYQRGAELLRSDALSDRLVGIDALHVLAEERPGEYRILIMRLLCAFVRRPTTDDALDRRMEVEAERDFKWHDLGPNYKLREDVQTAMDTIGICHERQSRIEAANGYWLDFNGADLNGADLRGKDLSSAHRTDVQVGSLASRLKLRHGTDFSGAKLHKANLNGARLPRAHFSGTELLRAELRSADLSGASFWNADLTRATFWSADLTDAVFRSANLSGADFSGEGAFPAIGLTQAQLDSAVIHADDPPWLYGMVDPGTDPAVPLRPPERWFDVKPQPKSDDAPDD